MRRYAGLLYMEDLEELFTDVQCQRVFPDQKTFVDCIPKLPVAEILEQYRQWKRQPDGTLETFVMRYFDLPRVVPQPAQPMARNIDGHIADLWKILSRAPVENTGTLIGLPYRFIVPGGRFREIFYWDTYFTMLGLAAAGETQFIEDVTDNFAFLLRRFGLIPNGNRTYFLTRSQPPFFAHIIRLLQALKGDEILVKYITELTLEYQFWMQDAQLVTEDEPVKRRVVRMPDGALLNRYWDEQNTPRAEGYAADLASHEEASAKPSDHYRHLRGACESGWDFSGRWLRDGKTMHRIYTCDLIPVDLNSLLWYLESTLEEAYRITGKPETANSYGEKAAQRKAAIEKYCWHPQQQTFTDYDHRKQQPSDYLTMAMAYPLFCGLAGQQQANLVLEKIADSFLQPGGLLTSLHVTGQQWDAPNGWAPLQWIGYEAAMRYKNEKLAQKIRHNWMMNVERVFATTGKMMEKYNVVDISLLAGGGEYPNQDGFGWTNGVYAAFKRVNGQS